MAVAAIAHPCTDARISLDCSQARVHDRHVPALLLVLALALPARADAAGVVKPFPEGFLWGTAISAFQSEMGLGAPTDERSDWWVWAHDAANIESGRVSGDLPEAGPGFYDRYEDDARLAARRLRSNALRLSIEWSRIFPESTAAVDISGGITPESLAALDALADPTEVAHYRAVLAALRARGLEPLVTLNHFSLPLWIHEPTAIRDAFAAVDPVDGDVPAGLTRAGWLDPAIVDEFAKFAAYAGATFGDLVDLWCTVNEPVVILVSGFINIPGIGGNFPPGVFNFAAVLAAIPQLVVAHARAYDALHAADAGDADGDGAAAQAGVVANLVAFHPQNPGAPLDVAGTAHADYLYNQLYLRAVTSGAFDANLDGDTDDPGEDRPDLAGRGDFVGVNYYLRARVAGLGAPVTPRIPLFDFLPTLGYRTPENPGGAPCPSVCSDFGWEIYPAGLGEVLAFAGTLGLPVYITENGIADAADRLRAGYIVDHLATLSDAIAAGVADVRGYLHWSLTDNFEWSSGYYPKFGLFAYDPSSGRRKLRRGARPLRAIAVKNGITAGLLRRYGP
jgi:beta-glucosidase/6-phospho-beta-glucosidase/beta-galactosidase